MKQHLDERKATEWYFDLDIACGIPLDDFLDLADMIFEKGYKKGWAEACCAGSNN